MSDRRFEGKVVVATGAASGMGRAACHRFAAEGASVFGVDVNGGGLGETLSAVAAAGGKMGVHVADLSQPDACAGAIDAAVAAYGRLDVLLNIAGLLQLGHAKDLAVDEWNRVVAVNLSAPFFLSQAAIPHLLETHGNIVNIASNAGLMGQAYTAAYCATKGGIVSLTRALAMEFMNAPIRINAVCPGGTKTAMQQGVTLPEDVDWKLMKRFANLREQSEPEEIAAAMAFVASDEASAVHGSIFTVDGGLTAG